MNIHSDAHFQRYPTPLQAELIERHKAGRARMAAAAYVPALSPPTPKPKIEPVQGPLVTYARAQEFREAGIIIRASRGVPNIDILRAVAKHYGLTVANIVGPRRYGEMTFARWIAVYLIRHFHPRKSTPEIGRMFNRDHTSIISGMKRLKKLMAYDATIAAEVDAIRASIAGGGQQ